MLEEPTIKTLSYLAPFAFLYRMGVNLRNKCFDWGLLKSEKYDIPILSVGNITVGGTGKTPHIEYLIRLLSPHFRIAVLSRGYKRKTKGFIIANEQSTACEIGDEPFQMKLKFPEIVMAVDANRRRGIQNLLAFSPKIDIILLDDAFQHRYLIPSMSILLTDFNRPIYQDKLLPEGLLREPISGKSRANIVIVTKCPEDQIKPMDFRIISKHLQLYPYQNLYFTSFRYDNLLPVFPEKTAPRNLDKIRKEENNVLIVSGIASPETFINYINQNVGQATFLNFPDHHDFTKKDIRKIEEKMESLTGEQPLVIVTEKDAARFLHNKFLSEKLKQCLYFLPLKVHFLQQQENSFNSQILDQIQENKKIPSQAKKESTNPKPFRK